ncbi:methionyl-tRNA formyltransferase [Fluviispira multicolorata]|uniref:Methionyl-tRNA formyltransferase n=1 Tax=Fluviispira multicolorata TaxID=2654512 RepID=A0A833N2X5_9BACT|nr:methionyl-tRNA formyltransferase [Fluviispira multicolorata]KAB8029075.1 methionyl-tRNA formyltransferase [Fluviispira multicolorata]
MQADNRKKIVFLGTPQVAEKALRILLEAHQFLKVILVVSQPPSRSLRGKGDVPSPTHKLALERGIPVLTPHSAKDPIFLSDIKLLEPDLCITAAYGNYLPKDFLAIPKFGTLNIHPSLLPLYRGASPVQRALEVGVNKTGVSILFSVAAMDAGPIAAQEEFAVNNSIKAPELLDILFEKGAHLLIKTLEKLFSDKLKTEEQDHSKATKADKIKVEEGILDFKMPALALHNKVRAFAGWPNTKSSFILNDEPIEMKIITTRVSENSENSKIGELIFTKNSLNICCGDTQILEILEMQLPGKKVVSALDFQNGIKGKLLKLDL